MRLVRSGVTAVLLFGLVGLTAPPAQATTLVHMAFAGSATASGGLGYPCVPFDVNTHKCQPALWTGTEILGTNLGLPLPQLNLPNTRTLAFSASTMCVAATAHVNKPGHGPVSAGVCALSATGTVSGFCGLNQDLLAAVFTDAGGSTYSITLWFTSVGATVLVTGRVTAANGQTGHLFANAVAVPVPTVGAPPGNGCAAKTATHFTVAGAGVITLT